MAKEKSERVKKPIYKRWWLWVIVAIIAIGAFAAPGGSSEEPVSTKPETEQVDSKANDGNSEAIVLIAGEIGQYGTPEKIEQDGEIIKEYIAYRVPAGSYAVTNKGNQATQVTVYKNGTTTNEDGNDEQIMSETKPLLLDVDDSAILTIQDDEYISIIEPSSIELVLQ